jgi:hypothetical protein
MALAQAAVTAGGGQIALHAAYIDVSCPQQPAFMPRAATRGNTLKND